MVSLGGDGSSKAAAAATCFGPLLTGGLKWVDTDADAENTANAKQVKCGEGLVTAFPGLSCKSIKMSYPLSRNGLYWVIGLSQAFLSKPKRVYCWQEGTWLSSPLVTSVLGLCTRHLSARCSWINIRSFVRAFVRSYEQGGEVLYVFVSCRCNVREVVVNKIERI